MLKRILFAVAPLVMIFGTASFGTANADDDLLKSLAAMDNNSIVAVDAADSALEDADDFGQSDVDALLGNDDKDKDAVAASFRRIGWGYGHGYRSYGYRSYGYRNYGYHSYGYNYYRPYYSYYRPVTYHYPVYTSYWACY